MEELLLQISQPTLPCQENSVWHCPVCYAPHREGRKEFRISDSDWPMTIYRCSCGLRYSNYVMLGSPTEIYDACYFSHPRYTDSAGRIAYIYHLAEFFQTARNMLPVSGPGRLLDVGCATGDFVKWALEAGWDAEGIDISEEAITIGIQRGLPLRMAPIESLSKNSGVYDVVTMWDVLEHLHQPSEALLRLQQVLRPGGLFLFKTVSCTSLLDMLSCFLNQLSWERIQAPLKRMYVPGHLFYFTTETLHRLLENTGWRVITIHPTDTPPEALFDSRLLRLMIKGIFTLQKMTNRGYELMVACSKE